MGENPDPDSPPQGWIRDIPNGARPSPGPMLPGMTTEQPTAPRALRRRTDDRVIGGVASGLGDFLNIDPLLIRIGFVGLMVFGGMGLLLYIAGWLLIPEQTSNHSIAENVLRRIASGNRVVMIVFVVIGAFLFMWALNRWELDRSDTALLVVVAIVAVFIGGLIMRPSGADTGGAAGATSRTVDGVAPALPADRPAPRLRSPLGLYVIGAVFVGIGGLALARNVAGADVTIGQFAGLALGILGLGLVVGAWWGSARLLIPLGLLFLPIAFGMSLVRVPLAGGWGTHRFTPLAASEVAPAYQLTGGQLRIDLTEIKETTTPVTVHATVAFGEVYVILPPDASAEVDATVGGGAMYVAGEGTGGTDVQNHYTISGDGPRFNLDLDAGIGSVRVDNFDYEAY